MIKYNAGKCDIAVIGAGHAGIEAALAAARLGLDTVCFSVNLDSIGNMPCIVKEGLTEEDKVITEFIGRGAKKR